MATAIEKIRNRLDEQDEQLEGLVNTFEEVFGKKINKGETVTVEIPVAGRTNQTETVEISRERNNTFTKEVPLQGGDVENPDTETVVYVQPGPTSEDIEKSNQKINELRSEAERKRQERLQRHRKGLFATPYKDVEEDSDIPVAGQRNYE